MSSACRRRARRAMASRQASNLKSALVVLAQMSSARRHRASRATASRQVSSLKSALGVLARKRSARRRCASRAMASRPPRESLRSRPREEAAGPRPPWRRSGWLPHREAPAARVPSVPSRLWSKARACRGASSDRRAVGLDKACWCGTGCNVDRVPRCAAAGTITKLGFVSGCPVTAPSLRGSASELNVTVRRRDFDVAPSRPVVSFDAAGEGPEDGTGHRSDG